MDVKLFSSNFKIATFLILAHFSFLMSYGQNKPKSNLVKIGNCTYSVDGNISAFNEAVLLQKKGDLNEAIPLYKRSLNNVFKCNYKTYNNYGVCASLLGNYRQSDSLFRLSIKVGSGCDTCDYTSEITDYNRFLNKISDDEMDSALFFMAKLNSVYTDKYPQPVGYVYLRSRAFSLALKNFSKADSKLSEKSNVNNPNTFNLYYNLALATWFLKDTISANKNIDKALKLNKNDVDALTLRGIITNTNVGDFPDQYFKRAVDVVNNEFTNYNLSLYHMLSGNYDDAISSFSKMFNESKERSDTACFGLAASLYRAGRYEESKKYFGMLYKIKSGRLLDYHLIEKATLFINSRDFAEAAEIFSQLILDGSNMAKYAEVGYAVIDYNKGKYADAVKKFKNIESKYSSDVYNFCTSSIRNICFSEMQEPFTPIRSRELYNSEFEKRFYVNKLVYDGFEDTHKGSYQNAYSKALEANSILGKQPPVLLLKGYSEYLLGKLNDAGKTLSEYNSIDTTGPEGFKILALVNAELRDYPKAMENIAQAIGRAKTGQDQLINFYGLIYGRWSTDNKLKLTQNFRDSISNLAIASFSRAYSINPRPAYQFNMGTFYAEKGDTAKARSFLTLFGAYSWVQNNLAVMNFSNDNLFLAQMQIGIAMDMETSYESQALKLIENNQDIIVKGKDEPVAFIYAYNSFPKYIVKPIELIRPYYFLYPEAKLFVPEFEIYSYF